MSLATVWLTVVGAVEMKSPLKLPDDESTVTLGQFHRDRDAEAVRARAQAERRQERAEQEIQRQREGVRLENALRWKRQALRLDQQRRLAIAEGINR